MVCPLMTQSAHEPHGFGVAEFHVVTCDYENVDNAAHVFWYQDTSSS